MEQVGKLNDIEKYLEINTNFHKKIWDTLPNKILQRKIEFVHGWLMRYTHYRISAFQEPAVLNRSLQEHKKILRALEDKDKRALESLVKSNLSLLLDKQPQKSGEKEL